MIIMAKHRFWRILILSTLIAISSACNIKNLGVDEDASTEPWIDNSEPEQQDEYTDDIDRWGAGKLRIHGAIANAITAVADEPRRQQLVISAYPNPFNPHTTFRFYQPAVGSAVLRIFSVDGRQIWSRQLDDAGPGWREVVWDGKDGRGLPVSSGLYFAYLRQGEKYAAIRVTLMK